MFINSNVGSIDIRLQPRINQKLTAATLSTMLIFKRRRLVASIRSLSVSGSMTKVFLLLFVYLGPERRPLKSTLWSERNLLSILLNWARVQKTNRHKPDRSNLMRENPTGSHLNLLNGNNFLGISAISIKIFLICCIDLHPASQSYFAGRTLTALQRCDSSVFEN